MDDSSKLLLIDTCGDTAGVALFAGQEPVAVEEFAPGGASVQIVGAVRRLLQQVEWMLADLNAVGVVSGPGSFTGARTGMAVAKGLCEAASLPLASVSRLEVLADAAGMQDGFAALDAGRGEVYVRDVSSGREWLCCIAALQALMEGKQIAVAETRLEDLLPEARFRALHVGDAIGAVLRSLETGGSDVALVEANYVRGEGDIYRKTAGAR